MFIPRIYQAMTFHVGEEIELDTEASQHLLKVLRLRVGDALIVFNGRGGEYSAELVKESKRVAYVKIGEFQAINRESPIAFHLGQGLSRNDRMDYAIQKSTELGVAEITPLLTEYCQVKLEGERMEKRVEHWQKIAISACEQSGRTKIPTVHAVQTLEDWVHARSGLSVICDLEDDDCIEHTLGKTSINILVGPVSGFSAAERQYAKAQGFHSLSLGPRILRTETAPVVALTRLQLMFS